MDSDKSVIAQDRWVQSIRGNAALNVQRCYRPVVERDRRQVERTSAALLDRSQPNHTVLHRLDSHLHRCSLQLGVDRDGTVRRVSCGADRWVQQRHMRSGNEALEAGLLRRDAITIWP